MAEAAEKVTKDQANDALRALVQQDDVKPVERVVIDADQAEHSETREQEAAAETATEEKAEAKEEPSQEAASDDVQSLRKRVEESEAREKEREERWQARLKAQNERYSENERILRERYLRKSTATDKALRVLKAAKTEAGVDPTEADRVIAELESTMNPASQSYAAPEPVREEQAIVLNRFLNEVGMDAQEADRFGQWIRMEAPTVLTQSEQAIANESLDGFLRLAHTRWQYGLREKEQQQKRDEAVNAVKSVQRVQKQAARAAESTSGAPKKQPTKQDQEVDVRKLTQADISRLVRQSWEQYTR